MNKMYAYTGNSVESFVKLLYQIIIALDGKAFKNPAKVGIDNDSINQNSEEAIFTPSNAFLRFFGEQDKYIIYEKSNMLWALSKRRCEYDPLTIAVHKLRQRYLYYNPQATIEKSYILNNTILPNHINIGLWNEVDDKYGWDQNTFELELDARFIKSILLQKYSSIKMNDYFLIKLIQCNKDNLGQVMSLLKF